jgi:tensin
MSDDQLAADMALARALQRQEAEDAEAVLKQEEADAAMQARASAPADDFGGWGSWFDKTANMAGDFALKAASTAAEAATTAAEKATVLASKAEEMRAKYDLDNVFANTIGVDDVTATGKVVRRVNDQLDFVYVTENLVAMSFPVDPSRPGQQGGVQSGNDINKVSAYLKKHHEGKYMIWNISEESYDASYFNDQVLEYRFPGHPAPPLGLLFKICTSIESWLDADEDNVGIVHCLTGKGRTATLLACALTWNGEFSSPTKALEYIADRKGIDTATLTIPSQRRYLSYFSNMLEGVKPRSEPILLRRVIMNTIPVFGENGAAADGDGAGCCPYLQLFKGGKLISTSVPVTENDQQQQDGRGEGGTGKVMLKWSKASDGCVSFNVDCALQGDILLRARHAAPTGQRISMYRAAFHTGYVPTGVLRLTKEWLDGAEGNPRFADDFFIDLIFAPMGVQLPGDAAEPAGKAAAAASSSLGDKDDSAMAAAGTEPPPPGKLGVVAAPSDSGLVIDASSADRYERTLHNDSRFWEAVTTRKNKARKRQTRRFKSVVREAFTLDDGEEEGMGYEHDEVVTSVMRGGDPNDSLARASKDRDLIEALAQAELDGDDEHFTSGEGGGGGGMDDSALNLSGAGIEPVGLGLAASPAATSNPASSATAAASVNTPGNTMSQELAELAELERELGLDSSYSPAAVVGVSPPGAGAGAGEGDDEEDDLDDLEKYLESIQG